jgi:hypothetical protein
MEATTENWDVVVIGGGAAGLSAAPVLGRARRRVAVIDAGERRNAPATHIHGFLSRDGMPPADLLSVGRSEVTRYGVQIINDTVIEIANGFTVRLASRRMMSTRRILITTGVPDELPDIPGVRERWRRDLLHCPYCHGWEVHDQPLGVLGTLPGSVVHAHLVRQWSDDVTFFVTTYHLGHLERTQLEARGSTSSTVPSGCSSSKPTGSPASNSTTAESCPVPPCSSDPATSHTQTVSWPTSAANSTRQVSPPSSPPAAEPPWDAWSPTQPLYSERAARCRSTGAKHRPAWQSDVRYVTNSSYRARPDIPGPSKDTGHPGSPAGGSSRRCWWTWRWRVRKRV